jgi:hypothetical protein
MPSASLVKPTHKAIVAYYQTLQAYGEHEVEHETALRSAFQNLLAETAKAHHWMLVPEQPTRVGGKLVRPDGTLCDEYNLHRGYWEAKDTDDKLDAEISKKIAKGYPLTNTIFEDTRQAVLFQGKREVRRTDLTQPQNLADLLNHFYAYTELEHEDFEQAVAEFKDRVPDLARGLADKINAAHQGNPKFQVAFDSFFTLCQTALNPNISQAAVDEMLVQHLLTERLIRKIFDNPEFTQRNVIAAEVEKVIAALSSRGFNRDDFQKSLDRFYVAIENAARTMPESLSLPERRSRSPQWPAGPLLQPRAARRHPRHRRQSDRVQPSLPGAGDPVEGARQRPASHPRQGGPGFLPHWVSNGSRPAGVPPTVHSRPALHPGQADYLPSRTRHRHGSSVA